MRQLLGLLVLIMALPVHGQRHDGQWIMGRDYDVSDPIIKGNLLDFNSGELQVFEQDILLEMHSTMSSICDAEGNLQFYTNGCQIANWRHELMENGDAINPGNVYDRYCINTTYPWRGIYPGGKQSALSLPLPGTDSVYYLFHKAIELLDDPPPGGPSGVTRPFYYSIIDMRENGGEGAVVQKNEIIISEDIYYGQLTAVKHANGQDWWIFTPAQEETNGYLLFKFTSQGIVDTLYQEIGISTENDGGWANFSPDGRKMVRYEPRGDDIFLFDFDRETGLLSNFRHILIEEEEEWYGGVAFSPSSRFLYVSSYDYIYQFDTWAEDIGASKIVVAEYEYTGEFLEDNFWGMQLGPDCKLYVYCNSCDVIHVIHNPDEPGLACNFEQGAVQLPWPIFRSQPHFPNYRLGPVGDEGLPCTPVVSVTETIIPDKGLRLWPNPAGEYVYVGLRTSTTLSPRRSPRILDTYGRPIPHIVSTYEGEGRWALQVGVLPAGLYYVQVQTEEGIGVVKFVKG